MIAAAAPRAMPVRTADVLHHVPAPLFEPRIVRIAQVQLALLVLLLAVPLCIVFAAGVEQWTGTAVAALVVYTVNTIWVAAAAATAIIGLMSLPDRPGQRPMRYQADAAQPPRMRTAILVLICGEPPLPFARRVDMLWIDLR